jgi:hypothetical protein
MDFGMQLQILLSREQERHSVGIAHCKAGDFYSFAYVAEDHQTKKKNAIVDKRRFY